MKNLTRILALVLVFSLMISSAAFAASFTDIEDGTAVAEATHVLADLGILYGYEDGSFGPDKTITRAELVAVANRLQGLSDAAKAAGGVTAYTDVPADEWYAGDVNLATQMGIISGYGDGTFRPNVPVKYEEAVKIIVASLGYTQKYVLEKGGWPTGYLVIASEAEVTKGLTNAAGTEAPRGVVARLAFNALTAPMMVLDSYSTDGTAIYKPDSSKILLDEKLATYRLEGYVSSNNVSAVNSSTPTVKNADEVKFEISEKVGSLVNDFVTYSSSDKEYYYNSMTLLAGKTDAAANLGFGAYAYVQENADGDWEIASFVLNEKKNISVVIENTEDIQLTTASKYPSVIGNGAAEKYISVYDEDVDTTNTVYNLNVVANDVYGASASVIVNGKYLGNANSAAVLAPMHNLKGNNPGAAELGYYYAPKSGQLTLLDNNGDGDYDFIFVKSYETVLVDEVAGNGTRILTQGNNSYSIDLENAINEKQGYSYSLTMDGEEIEITDLQKNDVLSIAVTADGKGIEILGTRTTVEGTIDESDTASTINEWVFKVDGKEYVIANMVDQSDAKMNGVEPGTEGVLYLDVFGEIAYFDQTSSSSKNYGFIVGAGTYASVGDTTYEVQILGKDGITATYALADRVRVTDYAVSTNATSDTAANVYNNHIANLHYNNEWTLTQAAGSGAAHDAEAQAKLDNYAARLITYTVNASGKVSAMGFATTGAINEDAFVFNNSGINVEYNGNTAAFKGAGKYGITADTVVFSLPIEANSSKDDFEVTTSDTLADEDKYNVAFFNVDEDGNAGAILITNNSATVGKSSSLAVVKKIMMAKNDNGEDVYRVTFLQGGEEKTLTTTNELQTYLTGVVPGNVFEYAVNASGEMSKFAFGTSTYDVFDVTTDAGVYDNIINADSNTPEYAFGAVYAKGSNRTIQLAQLAAGATGFVAGSAERIQIDDDAVVTVVDLTKKNTSDYKVVAGAYADILTLKYEKDTGKVEDYNDAAVLVKYYKDKVTDVVVYLGYIATLYPTMAQ